MLMLICASLSEKSLTLSIVSLIFASLPLFDLLLAVAVTSAVSFAKRSAPSTTQYVSSRLEIFTFTLFPLSPENVSTKSSVSPFTSMPFGVKILVIKLFCSFADTASGEYQTPSGGLFLPFKNRTDL